MAFIIVVLSTSFFSWALQIVTEYRQLHPYVMMAMPLLIILVWWDREKQADVLSTRVEVRALCDDGSSPLRTVSIAAGFKQVFHTLLSHLCGASVGREAVGLQLGGWSARLRRQRGWYFGSCLAAGFAIVLGTPAAAAIFIFESKGWRLSTKDLFGVPILACLAYGLSQFLNVSHSSYYPFLTTATQLLSIGWLRLLLFVVVLVLFAVALAAVFLSSVSHVERHASRLRGGLLLPFVFLVSVTVLFYAAGLLRIEQLGLSGLGTQSLDSLFLLEKNLVSWSEHPLLIAIVKTLLTAAFVGFGLRGGELTPLLFVGSALSVGLALLFGLPAASMVAVGFPLVWGIAARRPIAAGVLTIEIFGFAPFAAIGFFVVLAVWAGIKVGDFANKLWVRSWPTTEGALTSWSRGLYD